MISWIKFLSVVVLMLAFGVFAGAALAQDTTTTPKQDNVEKSDKFQRRGGFGKRGGEGLRGGMRGGPEGMLRGLKDLNLTDAQKQQIHTIMESNKPDQATMEQMKTLRESRKSGGELTAEQKEQFKAARQAQRAKMESIHQQILNVLTPEQKQQLDAKRQEMEKRRTDRKQFRRDDKPVTDKTLTKPIDG